MEALDRAWVGVQGPIIRSPALTRGAAAATAAASSYIDFRAAVGPPVGGSGFGIPDAPISRQLLVVSGEEEFPKGGGGWAAHVPDMAEFLPQVLEGHRD